jgi:hypothetical protein
MYVEWQSPILIGQNVIMPSNQITLYVPQGTKAVYEEAPYWKGCKEIVEYNQTGIESISGKPLNPHSIIRADTPVFTLDGKPVPRKAGSRLSQGLYIVGGKKLLVR